MQKRTACGVLLGMLWSTILSAAELPSGVVAFSYPNQTVYSIQDTPMSMSGSLFSSIEPTERLSLANSYKASLNVFLIVDKATNRRCLIDAGYGNEKSKLLPRLAALGVAPDTISAVFITHIHPDHVGGLTLPDGKPAFPKATIVIARQEYEAWHTDTNRARLARHLKPCRKQLSLVEFGKEIAPFGLTPLCLPGHTPGHTVFRMTPQPGEEVYFVGDIVHATELQIPHYRYCARFDSDPKRAVASRKDMLERGRNWFGAHLIFPGKAVIQKDAKGYGFKLDKAK